QALLVDRRGDAVAVATPPLDDLSLAGAGVIVAINPDGDSIDALPCSTAVVLRGWGNAGAPPQLDAAACLAALDAAVALTGDGRTADAKVEEHPTPQHASLRVLVAEDNPVNQKVTRRILERVGHSVRVVDNGEDALDALDEQTFDAFIVDINMARLGGIDVVKLHRMAALGQPRLPIIAFSADATAETRQAALEAGIDLYLTKPIEPQRLLDALTELCRGDERPAPAAAETTAVTRISSHPRYRREVVPAIDWTKIETLARYTDHAFVFETLQEYLINAERLVAEIAVAIEAGDADALRDGLHALRGTSGNVGAEALWRLCREYHGITGRQLSQSGAEIMQRLTDDLQRFRLEFKDGSRSLGPSQGV
ncbi:MAG TPA: response regulator, partial [Rhodospirillales bacterium]|nr:response regulator [Rhodospirillales bacterium]